MSSGQSPSSVPPMQQSGQPYCASIPADGQSFGQSPMQQSVQPYCAGIPTDGQCFGQSPGSFSLMPMQYPYQAPMQQSGQPCCAIIFFGGNGAVQMMPVPMRPVMMPICTNMTSSQASAIQPVAPSQQLEHATAWDGHLADSTTCSCFSREVPCDSSVPHFIVTNPILKLHFDDSEVDAIVTRDNQDPKALTALDIGRCRGNSSTGCVTDTKRHATKGCGCGKTRAKGASQPCMPSSSPSASEATNPETVMLRNLPCDYGRIQVKELLDESGFQGLYNFMYVPFRDRAFVGYAIVNLIESQHAEDIKQRLEGFCEWTKIDKDGVRVIDENGAPVKMNSPKILEVAFADKVQGLRANIEKYRNSSIMHPAYPEEYKPAIFKNGKRVPFPKPDQPIEKPPRGKQDSGKKKNESSQQKMSQAMKMPTIYQ